MHRSSSVHSRLKLGFVGHLQRQVRSRLTRWLTRPGMHRVATQIACFPRDYIGQCIVAHGAYEDLILRCLFEQAFALRLPTFRNTVVLDVGANIGNHSAWFSAYFRKVIAFEPNPICVRLLEANLLMNRLGNVHVVPCGLSDREGVALLHANLNRNLGGSGFGEHLQDTATDSFEVRVRRGDEAISEIPDSAPVSLIKIDVEGHEPAVIRGLEQTIRKHAPIVMFEAQGSQGDNGSLAILQSLREMGYRRTYVVQSNSRQSGNSISRMLGRLVRGFEMQVIEVEHPEDRYYSLIIACVDPL